MTLGPFFLSLRALHRLVQGRGNLNPQQQTLATSQKVEIQK
jgi:hypothetical protein